MAKKNNKPAQVAAPAAPAASTTENNVVNNVQQMLKTPASGLDANHQVDLLTMLNQRFFLDKDAAKHTGFSEENIMKINEITACGLVVVLAEEVSTGNSNFAIRMRPTQLQAIVDVSKSMGIEINLAALPAPEENGDVTLIAPAVEVSEEAKQKIQEEKKLAEKIVELDPTKIENETQLIEALKQIMIKNPNLYQKIAESINFYRAYLGVQAHKSGKKEETERVKNMSTVDIFNEISNIVGHCPLVMSGVGNHLYTVTAGTKSPVAAFCALRNSARDRKTGVYAIDDATVADYVKIMIKWHIDLQIANTEAAIEGLKKDIALLSDDKEKNAAGIADLEEKIATRNKNIEHFNEVLGYVMNPSSDFVNNFLDNYTAHEKNEMRVFKAVADSYYDDIILKEMKQDGVRKNIQQYVGIITNLFRSGTDAIEGYSAANLVELEPVVQSTEETEDPEDSKKLLLPLRDLVRAYCAAIENLCTPLSIERLRDGTISESNMKRFTTIVCSVLFMLAGYFVASKESSKTNVIYAADCSPSPVKIGVNDLPLDLKLDLARKDTVRDTVTIIHHDTVHVVKYKTKYRTRKPVEPDTLPAKLKDTLYVPALKLKMQMGEKELMDTIITLGPAVCNNQ